MRREKNHRSRVHTRYWQPIPAAVEFRGLLKVLEELATFLTGGSDEEREQMQSSGVVQVRQALMREQKVFDLLLQCVQLPFVTFDRNELRRAHAFDGPSAAGAQPPTNPQAPAAASDGGEAQEATASDPRGVAEPSIRSLTSASSTRSLRSRRASSQTADAEKSHKAEKKLRRSPNAQLLHRSMVLCMRIAQLTLRDNALNKRYAMRFIEPLQQDIAHGDVARASETLREVFADNPQRLEAVTDEFVNSFIELLRQEGRHARFLEFLSVLCVCQGKAVRPNQWRVCRLLVSDAPELLLRLSVDESVTPRRVFIYGAPRYFDEFEEDVPLELGTWLTRASERSVNYLEKQLELLDLLVRGRNRENTPKIRELLPYALIELALAADGQRLERANQGQTTQSTLTVHSPSSARRHQKHSPRQSPPDTDARRLRLRPRLVAVVVDLYIDVDPHDVMTRVRRHLKSNSSPSCGLP